MSLLEEALALIILVPMAAPPRVLGVISGDERPSKSKAYCVSLKSFAQKPPDKLENQQLKGQTIFAFVRLCESTFPDLCILMSLSGICSALCCLSNACQLMNN